MVELLDSEREGDGAADIRWRLAGAICGSQSCAWYRYYGVYQYFVFLYLSHNPLIGENGC